jgi:hypothetical protein
MTRIMSAPSDAAGAPAAQLGARIGRFTLHFMEMCIPMCVGFVVGDLAYFAIAGAAGYSSPFSELPELSLLVVTAAMTVPMIAWMRVRGMDPRATVEMSAPMVVVAAALFGFGWAGVVEKSQLALLEHALMMPAMLIPMLLRVRFYSSPMAHKPVRLRGVRRST